MTPTPRKRVALGIEHKYGVNATVEARQQNGEWIAAVVVRHKPYLGRPGYYVRYPRAIEQWECHGGWKPEHCLRDAGRAALRGEP